MVSENWHVGNSETPSPFSHCGNDPYNRGGAKNEDSLHLEVIMETPPMGKVLVTAKIENLDDLNEVRKGQRKQEDIRRIEVADALVDTGASGLGVPKSMVAQLGLIPFLKKNVRTVNG